MKRKMQRTAIWLAWASCLPWLIPGSVLQAAGPPEGAGTSLAGAVADVRLTADGVLRGNCPVSADSPAGEQTVVLCQGSRVLAETRTNADGEFAFQGIAAGCYQIRTDAAVAVCRAWTWDAAPPVAADRVLVANPSLTVRGQQPISCLFYNPLVIGLIVAAAIAMPIAVHNAQDAS
jgi:hypothetical protein